MINKDLLAIFSRVDYWFRFGLIAAVSIAAAGLLVYRCLELGDYKHSEESKSLQQQQTIKVKTKPQKGLIVDTRGRLLAANKPMSTFFVDPVFLMSEPNEFELAEKFRHFPEIEDVLELEDFIIEDTIFNNPEDRYKPIKTGLSKEQTGFVKSKNLKGLGVIDDNSARNYLTKELFSHIIGFAASKKEFSEGLERVYYDELSGQPGIESYLADRARRPINLYQQTNELSHGVSLILTADAVIQLYARQALHDRCKEFNAESGIAIVIKPDNGEILAMANYPDFDPGDIESSEIDARRNRAVTDVYEPGSIMKPIIAAIALDEGVINSDTVIYCEKGQYCGKGFGCIGEYGSHSFENLTIKEIIKHSSNIGMAKIGQKMGAKRLYNGLKRFGFGERTTLKKHTRWTESHQEDRRIPEFLGESPGLLNRLERWNGYSVTRVPYGQEIGVTALQIAKAFCIIANGGRDVQPHIVRAFVDSNGSKIVTAPNAAASGYVIKPQAAEFIVQKAMNAVVNDEDGTGTKAALEDYTVFGKTGTANMAINNSYENQSYVASFVAGAPLDEPKIIVLISIIKPDRSLGKGYTGGTVAAPAVADIIQKTLDYMEH